MRMKQPFIRLFVLCIAFWLPVQTMAGVVMPMSRHALEQNAPVVGDEQGVSEMRCHDAMGEMGAAGAAGAAGADSTTAASHESGCNDCGVCHLASTGFMVSSPLTLSADPVGTHRLGSVLTAPPEHITEPPQHPPRTHV